MSVKLETVAMLPLLAPADEQRPVAWRRGPVLLSQLRDAIAAMAAQLPVGRAMVNLCEDRYNFIASYAAALSAGHVVLLPSSRAGQVVAEVQAAHPDSYCWDDAAVNAAMALASRNTHVVDERAAADATVMIGFTSGSTGQSQVFPKTWGSVCASTVANARCIREALGLAETQNAWVLATVPPQHMYGMELSVLLSLVGGMAVHTGKPLFPADIAEAIEQLPRPRILVSTPVHLRAIVESGLCFPPVDLIISATAPLDQALATAASAVLGGPLQEMFGSTETCIFATRRTAQEPLWTLYPGVELEPLEDGTQVHAPWFAGPVKLNDLVEMHGQRQFAVRGRSADMIDVAGKRASLADITRRLLAIPGVQDAAVFQPDAVRAGAICRVAALVVAPGLNSRDILRQLSASVDSAFLPRPLVLVERLPRNELGKLPRQALLQTLANA